MAEKAAKVSKGPPHKDVWFHIKHWGYILPVAYFASFLFLLVPLSGVLNKISDQNMENCVKISGPEDFKNCEDFVLSNEAGVAYVACDPVRSRYNKVMGINRLIPGEPVTQGNVWRVNYNEEPASIEKFDIEAKVLTDFHPLGIALDIHPATGEKTFISINLPHHDTASIDLFTLDDEAVVLVHKKTIRHPKIYSPNSIHILQDARFRADDGTPSFFFSNDHYFGNGFLKKLENYFFYLSNVGFYNARTGQIEKGISGLLFANGLSGNDKHLFVSETNRRAVRQYNIITTIDKEGIPHIHLDHVAEHKFDMAVDNVHYNQDKGLVTVAGHPKALDFIKYIIAYDGKSELPKPPSQVDVWDIKSGETKTLIQDDGVLFGTSSTGALDLANSKLVVSGLYEEGLLVCDV